MELYCRQCYEAVSAVMDKKNFAFTSFIREVLSEMRRLYPDVNLGYIMSFLEHVRSVRAAGLDGWAVFNFDDIAVRALAL